MISIIELKKLAEKATAGPWEFERKESREIFVYDNLVQTKDYIICQPHEKEDAAYIAAANPETIISLINQLNEANELIKLLDSKQYNTVFIHSDAKAYLEKYGMK